MSDRGVLVASKIFYQRHSCSKFFRNTCEGKEARKLPIEKILTDIFHEFEPPMNLLKWQSYDDNYSGNLVPMGVRGYWREQRPYGSRDFEIGSCRQHRF